MMLNSQNFKSVIEIVLIDSLPMRKAKLCRRGNRRGLHSHVALTLSVCFGVLTRADPGSFLFMDDPVLRFDPSQSRFSVRDRNVSLNIEMWLV